MNFLNITAAFLMIFAIITYSTLEKHFQSEYSNHKHEIYLTSIHNLQNGRAKNAYLDAFRGSKLKEKEKDKNKVKISLSEQQFRNIADQLLMTYYPTLLIKSPYLKIWIINQIIELSSQQYKIENFKPSTGRISKIIFNNKDAQKIFYSMLLGKLNNDSRESYPPIGKLFYLNDKNELFIRYHKMTHDIILNTCPELAPKLLSNEKLEKAEKLPQELE
jgi:hypothetical protein